MSLWATIALFVPVFLCLELVSAAPGRPDLDQVVRHGLRNFGRHLVYLARDLRGAALLRRVHGPARSALVTPPRALRARRGPWRETSVRRLRA